PASRPAARSRTPQPRGCPVTDSAPSHVVIAGGGVAGLEATLALHDLAGDRVRITLLSSSADFVYRPMAVAQPFSAGHITRHPLGELARDTDATLVVDGLQSVDHERRTARTTGGRELAYDMLVVATGA